eukprot:8718936-Lingulodinium_polyedra.AAC.1
MSTGAPGQPPPSALDLLDALPAPDTSGNEAPDTSLALPRGQAECVPTSGNEALDVSLARPRGSVLSQAE